jgi:polyribonucleotide nucleotidyltransferase
MRVGVIGGGLMGSGIAEVCARSGVDVTVVEVDKARGRIGLRIVGMEDVDGGGGDNGAEGSAGDDEGKPRRRRRRLTVPE